ncbi:hypothetical protein HDU67_008667 [Dinochytrium kinnereticum]|nr:hypothetical protein HDU67_008667 [Dinochytrium kinnereticum]
MVAFSALVLLAAAALSSSPVSAFPALRRRQSPGEIADTIKFLHTNDVHAHLEEFNDGGVSCSASEIASEKCYGGAARLKYKIDEIRASFPKTVLFDIGDQFQGTLFFNFFKAEPLAEIMNDFGYTAMTLGNHEFDITEEYLGSWMKQLKFPVLSANIPLEQAPNLAAAGLKKSMELKDMNLGIIGVTTNTTADVTTGGKGITFGNPLTAVQAEVDLLRAKGYKRIVLLSHIGYEDDLWLAANIKGLDVIMGGHTHTMLLADPKKDARAGGFYPTPVTNAEGKTTYVVTAWRWGQFLGEINLNYDANDNLISVTGEPVNVTFTTPKDPIVDAKVKNWAKEFEPLVTRIIGKTTNFPLEDPRNVCRRRECAIGNLIADALLEARFDFGCRLSMTNTGGIRATLTKEEISYGDIQTILPFGNTIAEVDITGQAIMDMLELTAGKYGPNGEVSANPITIPVFGGIRYSADLQKPIGSRVDRDLVRILDDDRKFVPLDLNKVYKMASNDFVAAGQDNILPRGYKFVIYDVMADAVAAYIERVKTVSPIVDGRFSVRGANVVTTSLPTTRPASTTTITTSFSTSTTTSAGTSTTTSTSAGTSTATTDPSVPTYATGSSSSKGPEIPTYAVPSSVSTARPVAPGYGGGDATGTKGETATKTTVVPGEAYSVKPKCRV